MGSSYLGNMVEFAGILATFLKDPTLVPMGKISPFENLKFPKPGTGNMIPKYDLKSPYEAIEECIKNNTIDMEPLLKNFDAVLIYDPSSVVCSRFMSAPCPGLNSRILRTSSLVLALRASNSIFVNACCSFRTTNRHFGCKITSSLYARLCLWIHFKLHAKQRSIFISS